MNFQAMIMVYTSALKHEHIPGCFLCRIPTIDLVEGMRPFIETYLTRVLFFQLIPMYKRVFGVVTSRYKHEIISHSFHF